MDVNNSPVVMFNLIKEYPTDFAQFTSKACNKTLTNAIKIIY